MTLEAGIQLGHYEITGTLGAGGMGEVYRATDTKLGRDVAIKTLPKALADDADRLSRFEREAKLLASLNHAHIAAVYGLDEHDGTLYIAMELVEGESLEDKLKKGPLPVEDALHLGLQIALALEAAHEKAIVHRDLKPANVMITAGGVVKVLDFGLAKAFSGDPNEASPAHSPALSLAMTQQGLVLGTASYMSPEQASGQATDQRADVWAFGVVLYEMLTGMPVFGGESVPHILAGVLRGDPDWSRLPKRLNPRVRQLLERCLEKKVRDRYHSIADARVDIEHALADPLGKAVASTATKPLWQRAVPAAVAVIITMALAGSAGWWIWPSFDRPVNRFSYPIPANTPFRNTFRNVALSPDGRRFVYNAQGGLYLREMDDLVARLISGSETNMAHPFFSPDGGEIAFWSPDPPSIMRIDIGGGASIPVTTTIPTPLPLGGVWHADGSIVYAALNGGIFTVPSAGGEPRMLVEAAPGEVLTSPSLLPDGDSVLFTVNTGLGDDSEIAIESLVSGQRRTLIDRGFGARYVPTGHIVYAFEDGLFAVAFDLERSTVRSGSASLVQNVMQSTVATANYDIAADGTLVYVRGSSGGIARTVVWVDRAGNEEPIDRLPVRDFVYVHLSADGRYLALDARDDESDIWIWDLQRETMQRLTFDPGANRGGMWSPDGQRVVFSRALDGTEEVFWQARDGSGTPEPLTLQTGFAIVPTDIIDDALLYVPADGPDVNIFMIPLGETDAEPVLLLPSASNAEISPNGRFIVYQSRESGRPEIYVRPFPDVDGGLWQISRDGGTRPRWSRDGTEVFYVTAALSANMALMSVDVEYEPTFTPGTPNELFSGDYATPRNGTTYDVSLDGERFLMFKIPVGGDSVSGQPPEIVIVQNWTEELKTRVPVE